MKKCKKCGAPLEGFLYKTIGKLMGVKPSEENPEICNKCAEEQSTESTGEETTTETESAEAFSAEPETPSVETEETSAMPETAAEETSAMPETETENGSEEETKQEPTV